MSRRKSSADSTSAQSWRNPNAPGMVFANQIIGASHEVTASPAFAGWGEVYVLDTICEDGTSAISIPPPQEGHKLGELSSTAICGNDITSSCFYVIGALAAAAGVWAPIGALIAIGTLWLFRWIYTESVTALPFNGGIYNILLNTLQRKQVAALIATLTMLSYISTAVVSALSAGAYLQSLIDDSKSDPMEEGSYVIYTAIALIIFFCMLKLIGISESAAVAAFMFVAHLLTMAVLAGVALVAIVFPVRHLPFSLVRHNLEMNFQYTGGTTGVSQRIMLGFATAMLGVSGFESSANFVEEQEPGVFPKTLRNMWYAVSILNMTFILEALFATELEELVSNHQDRALSFLAKKTGGQWLAVWVSLDAFMVLAAAVLTSYVGFGGLTCRMAGDRCLPGVFQRSDRVATILFMFICISLILLLQGNSRDLSACYSFAFLTVMALWAISLFVLQIQRPKLPRAMRNNALIPAVAFILVSIALTNAVVQNHHVIPIFMAYLGTLVGIMLVFIMRVRLLHLLQKASSTLMCVPKRCTDWIGRRATSIRAQSSVVYFSKTANICRLNKAIKYIKENEDANKVRVVHIYQNEKDIPRQLMQCCKVLDCIYPTIQVDVVFVRGTFGAPMIHHLSSEWHVAANLMFINCPASDGSGKRIQDLHGVRVIMSHEEEIHSENVVPMSFEPEMERAFAEDQRPLSYMLEQNLARRMTEDMTSSHRTSFNGSARSPPMSRPASMDADNISLPLVQGSLTDSGV